MNEGKMDEMREKVRARTEDLIKRHGHTQVWTWVEVGGGNIWMGYTIGLSQYGLPDVCICGVPQDVGGPILNTVAKRMRENTAPIESPLDGIANFPMMLKAADGDIAADNMLGAYKWGVENGHKVLPVQLFYPDMLGVWPWEDRCDRNVVCAQALLTPEGRRPGQTGSSRPRPRVH